MKRTLQIITAGFLVLMTAAFGEAASATPLYNTQAAVVSYSDLDLETEAGASVLLRRLRRATERVCSRRTDFRACRQTSLQDAVTHLNRPLVTALHSQGRRDTRRQLAAR